MTESMPAAAEKWGRWVGNRGRYCQNQVMETDNVSAIEILGVDDCWERLEAGDLGRLAVSVAGRPDIFPINYVTTERTIFLRSAEGSKLVSIAINQAVAFEIDGYDEGTNEAWSVVLHGQARLIGHDAMEVVAETLPLYPWNTSPKHRFIQIVPRDVSGRRFIVAGRR